MKKMPSPVGVLLTLVLLSGSGRQCPAFLRIPSGFRRPIYTPITLHSPNYIGFGIERCLSENRSFRIVCAAKKKGRKTGKGGKSKTVHNTTGDKTREDEHRAKGTERGKKEDDFDDLLKSPQFLKKKIELMERQLEEKKMEIAAAKSEGDKEWEEWGPTIEKLEREFEVVKGRIMNETLDITGISKVLTLKEVITVSDNFSRASSAIKPTTPGAQKVKDHYDRINKSMEDVFDKLGMKTIPTVGEPFNYEVHQAVMSRPSEYEEDIICQELAKGFVVDEKLIRPAMVAVSTG